MIIYGIFRNQQCVYIGQTKNRFSDRISKYKSDVKFKRTEMVIIRAMLKHGFHNFTFKMLACSLDSYALDYAEIWFIEHFKPRYNVSAGGVTKKGFMAPVTRQRISAANRRRRPDQFRVTPIKCLELDKAWVSTSEAARELKLSRRSITNAVNGWANTAGGLTFIKLPKKTA